MHQRTTYSRGAVWLHWMLACLIIGMLVGGLLMAYLPEDNISLRVQVYNWHKTIGLLILVLSLVRLGWRMTHIPPAPLPELKTWEKHLSKFIHVLFYVFMIGMPLVGWALISTSKYPSFFFNWTKTSIPKLPFWRGAETTVINDANAFLVQTHEVMAYIAIALIGLHIAGAIKHHLAGQAIFERMLPALKAPGIKSPSIKAPTDKPAKDKA